MEAEEIVNNWFAEMFQNFQKEVRPQTEDDLIIAGVLFGARKYTRAVLSLLLQKHISPAKALLRILCELYVRFYWCLDVPGDTKDVKQTSHLNFMRWDYLRLLNDKKLLKNLKNSREGDFRQKVQESLEEVHKGIEKYKKLGIKCMPDMACILNTLSSKNDGIGFMYPEIYLNFNRAIHLDRNTFRRLIQYNDDDNKIMCYDDWVEDINRLYKYCLCMSGDIIILIRKYYNLETEKLGNECLSFVSKYT